MTEPRLRRYTTTPALLRILRKKVITLLDPIKWDDSNDSYSLSVFKEQRNLQTLLALCFTETAETYHHWHVFAGDSSGVCIIFNKDSLLKHFDKSNGFDYGPVDYRTLDDLRNQRPSIAELPFIKRGGYVDECEFRIIYKNRIRQVTSKDVRIPIECIEKIYLNPWMPKALVQSFRETIGSIEGCERLNKYVFRSTLVGNNEWKELVSEAA